ncbi:hypothetical protein EDB86DRAFT_2317568 [Lactarius hatsudake]|nr:hypothetical protein EDB86DRAFT_2317568 [Lactarius hatsudake]
MGSCCSKPTREVASQEQSLPIMPHGVGVPASSSQRSGTKPGLPTAQVGGESLPERPIHEVHSRTKSSITPSSRGPSSDHGQISADTSRRRPTTRHPPLRLLKSTVRQVVPEHFKFRILVVGESRSGRSSLINAVFKVDAAAEPKDTRGKADVNVEFHPEDNRHLIVHECSDLGSQSTDPQNLQTIRDFISRRTNASRSPSERLHAVWICVPASDAITGRFGEGVKDILGMRTVPVILILTKFDVLVNETHGGAQQREHARAEVLAKCEDSCRRLCDKVPGNEASGRQTSSL